jgi:hypothetical protein
MKKLRVLYASLIFVLLFPVFSFAAEPLPAVREGIDIVFAVDVSGSMKINDPENFTRDFLGLLTSVADPKGVRIGIVGYNTGIKVSLPVTDISSEEGRASVEKAIASLVPSGDTDLGLGLSEAKRLLDEAGDDHEKAIFLISDGEAYDAPRGRGEEASAKDAEEVREWANSDYHAMICKAEFRNYNGSQRGNNISIWRNYKFFGNVPSLSEWDGFFGDVLSSVMQSQLLTLAELEGTGSTQEVTLSVPHGLSDAVSVIFASDAPVSNLSAEQSGLENVRVFKGNTLSAVVIENPAKGDINIRFTAKEGSFVEVCTIYSGFAFSSELSVSETEEGAARAFVGVKKDGVLISDKDFYESLGARIVFRRLLYDTEEKDYERVKDELQEERPVSAGADGVFAEYDEDPGGRFAVRAAAFFHAPFYFEEEVPGNGSEIIFEREEAPPARTIPWISIFMGGTILLLAIIILVMLFGRKKPVPLFKTPKHPYAGKLVCYVIKAENGAEYPPFTFVLSGYYSSDPVSLESILNFALGDDLGIKEAAKIIFSPGPSHGLVFRHDTSQTVTLGPLVTNAGESYIMDYGSKLYLMLKSERVELELHYKQAGPKETAAYAPHAG